MHTSLTSLAAKNVNQRLFTFNVEKTVLAASPKQKNTTRTESGPTAIPPLALLLALFVLTAIAVSQDQDERHQVPQPDVARQAIAKVQEVFSVEYSGARTPEQLSSFARELASSADMQPQPLERWAMLSEAGRLAAEAGDVNTVFEVIDKLSTAYRSDRMKLELDAVDKMAARATPYVASVLANRVLEICKTLADRRAYDDAEQVAVALPALLVKARDKALSTDFRAFQARMRNHRKTAEAQAAKDAANARKRSQMLKLANDWREDPEACLEAGSFFCFETNEWEFGIPLLANSSDKDLVHLARVDAAAQTPDELLDAAAQWERWADSQKDEWKGPALDRATTILTSLASQASGLDQIRIEKEIVNIREKRSRVRDKSESRFDADAIGYIRRVEAADGRQLENSLKTAINDFIVGTKDDGVWDSIVSACLLCGARSLSGALVPLKGTPPTSHNFRNDDYSRTLGLLGSPERSTYLDTNLTRFTHNNNHLAVYISQPPNVTAAYAGASSESWFYDLYSNKTASGITSYLRNESPGTAVSYSHSHEGLFGMTRVSPTQALDTHGGAAAILRNITSTAPPASFDITIFRRKYSTPGYTDARLAFYSVGKAVDLDKLSYRVARLVTQIRSVLP